MIIITIITIIIILILSDMITMITITIILKMIIHKGLNPTFEFYLLLNFY